MKTYLYFAILFILPLSNHAQDRMADSLILVQLYNTLDGPNWNNPENWLTTAPLQEWKGIFTQSDRVVKIELISQGTSGNFPVEILGLDQLHTFEIRSSSVSGEIPPELVQLTHLKRFMMNGTGISGDILNIWNQFDNLQSLGLSQNNLTGSLPDIGDALTLLYIQGNQLTGEIPASWTNKNVKALQIQENNLSGTYDIFSTWPDIGSINLSDNNWDAATFPEWLDDRPLLKRFTCENCGLYGPLPSTLDFSNSPEFSGLFITGNDLSGDISLLFNNPSFDKSHYLRARGNNFSGEFPAHKLTKAFAIDVRSNHYSSLTNFPTDLEIETFDISYNNFNYTTLEPVQNFIEIDSIVGVIYEYQSNLLTTDTLLITSATNLTIAAGDEHPDTKYVWKKNGAVLTGEVSASLEVVIMELSDGGSYYCEMTNPKFPLLELDRNKIQINVDFSSGTTYHSIPSLTVYPNPTSHFINVTADNLSANAYYKITNASGQLMRKDKLDNTKSIFLDELPTGIYHLQLYNEGAFAIKKIIKL